MITKQQEETLSELSKRGCLFKNQKGQTAVFLGGQVTAFLRFQNNGPLHEESQNHFAIYYKAVMDMTAGLPVSFLKREEIFSLLREDESFLKEGTVISFGDFPEREGVLAFSWGWISHEVETDPISSYHNMVNYLIPVRI